MGRGSFLKTISIMLFFLSTSAFSETGSVGDLDELQKQRFLYEVKSALNKVKQEAESYGNGTSMSNSNTPAATQASSVNEDLPSLIKINGRKIVISLSDGSTRSVSVGEVLPGGKYKVNSVSLNRVSVIRIIDGKNITLN